MTRKSPQAAEDDPRDAEPPEPTSRHRPSPACWSGFGLRSPEGGIL